MLKVVNNIKGFFADTRRRNIYLLTLAIALLLTFFSIFYFYRKISTDAEVSLNRAPSGIRSIPGSLNPTDEYASLQHEENIRNANIARETGSSAIPTIINSQSFGEGITSEQLQTSGGLDFVNLAQGQQELIGEARSLWTEDLRSTNCSQESIEHAIAQGATAEDLLAICGCNTLRENGYDADQLRQFGFTAAQLYACNFTAEEIKDAGFSLAELVEAGFSADELKDAGFSARQFLDAGFSAEELKDAGFSGQQLRDAGLSAQQLKDVGFNAQQLREAGFTPEQLKDAGFSAQELKDAGLSAQQLKDAGFNQDELAAAGFSPDELAQLDFSDGLSPERARTLAELGCDSPELKAAGFSATELKQAGCSADELKDAGFSPEELRDAGFTPEELKDAGFSAQQLREAGFTPEELKDAGFSAQELRDSGLSAQDLLDAGFSPEELKDVGFSAQELKDAGLSAQDLLDAGFTPQQLENAGIGLQDIGDLLASNIGLADENNSCSPERIRKLAQAGASAAQLKETLNCSVEQLQQQGFSDDELRGAGYADDELQAAGITPGEQGADSSDESAVDNEQNLGENNGVDAGDSLEGENQLTLDQVINAAPTDNTSDDLQRILEMQAAQMSEQQREQDIQQRQSAISGQMNQLTAQWAPTSAQLFVRGNPPEQEDAVGADQGVASAGNAITNTPLIRAGDIIFAVLDTAVNSDEPGPVLATIVSGKFDGAKLLGSLTTTNDGARVMLSFNTMALPDNSNTIPINAFAIDPDTARTALSSHTNRHILLRYGSLFASAFAEGVGNAFASSGTVIQGDGLVQTITTAQRSIPENLVVGVGEVGRRVGNNISPIFNRPPTVEVYSGSGMGILFTSDVNGN